MNYGIQLKEVMYTFMNFQKEKKGRKEQKDYLKK